MVSGVKESGRVPQQKLAVQVGERCELLDPVPASFMQSAPACKLFALQAAMEQVARRHGLALPPPVRRRDLVDALPGAAPVLSLRRQAKLSYGSVVGEMYSADQLVQMARANGFDTTFAERPAANDFTERLRQIIDGGAPPIVFFASGQSPIGRVPYPRVHWGWNEHAAVVVGYLARGRSTTFILGDGFDYSRAPAERLCKSTWSLPDWHRSETFYKMHGRWVEEESVRLTHELSGPQRRSKATDSTLRGMIVVPGVSISFGRPLQGLLPPARLQLTDATVLETLVARRDQCIVDTLVHLLDDRKIPPGKLAASLLAIYLGVFAGVVFFSKWYKALDKVN